MPAIQFLGRVLPLQFGINVSPTDIVWRDDPGASGLEAIFKLRISGSIVNVEVVANRISNNLDISNLLKPAFDFARAAVNLVAFASGLGPIVVFDTVIGEDGVPMWLLPTQATQSVLCTSFKINTPDQTDFNAVYSIVTSEAPLFRALNDLIECVWNPHVAPTNCGRVIDSICRMITPSTKGPTPSAWRAMQQHLVLSESYIRYISDYAIGPRHGDPAFIPGTITLEITERTWKLMDRYLEYRKRGNHPLSPDEFASL
jgi:hypothetical protein